ncbi:hypothetical protein EPUS_00661 [Endocarpon pusillum Z07020]|uniref:Uncharacterized protein n=1 Tax=Endocarpon pusillum (strain Z07020 / HMAS-L-300199) TaxID=1263415 RepID=U1G327_ENDPU|nr:uncharacterized protein EPUS_00661 [Endocarpon pusillum Z07020]ERF71672.1 hypothetical protein EPUS_00661 [Endocarpon pusillum Z07020]
MLALFALAAILAIEGAFAAPVDEEFKCPQFPLADNPNPKCTYSGAQAVEITPAQILTVAPTSATCDWIISNECRTNEQAALWISKSFTQMGIFTKAEQAALIALMAFESGEFKYNTNQQGHVGQGTRNMQSGEYNLKYAQSVPMLREPLQAIGTWDLGKVLKLVLPDELSFGSAAWFLQTQCSPDIREGLKKGGEEGWANYIKECVGTEPEPRKAYWQAAVKTLA